MSGYFWNNWTSWSKTFYWILLFFAFSGILFFCITYFFEYAFVINWKSTAYFQQVPIILDTIDVFPFLLEIEGENQIILQRFQASPYQVNLLLNYSLLVFISICFIVLLSISSFLSRIWFILSMGIWVVILSSFKLEMLLFFQEPGYIPLIMIGGSTVLLNYYFNAFGGKSSFFVRVLANLILFTFLGLSIYFLAEQQEPFLYLASQSLISILVFSIIFMFMVAHEIIAAFIYIITGSSRGEKSNHVHFIIITAIYLINLILLYLHHINFIDWDFWYINPYLLLFISSILGIWGYRQREEQYKNLYSFYPLGGYLYLTLMATTFASIGFFYGTANDPAYEILKEGIIYGHLAYGFLFVLYIIANFSGPLSNGLKVNKILYKPSTMPYFVYRFAGLIAVYAFVVIGNKDVPFLYTFGTYFNQQGDYAKATEQPILQEGYYYQSKIYASLNHHANYNLAEYYNERNLHGKSSVHYIAAIEGDPSAQAHVNLSRLYHSSHRYFDALFTLQEGAKKTDSGPLVNNLALLYSETDIIDSTFYYLEKALHDKISHKEAVANLEAFAAAHDLASFMDSLTFQDDEEEDIIILNNKIVRFNKQNNIFHPIPEVLKSAEGTDFFASGVAYNYLINTIYREDTSGIKSLVYLTDKFLSSVYNEKIRFGQSTAEYYHFYIADAFRRLNLLANESYGNNGPYFKTLGLWALEQDAPDQAALFFRMAKIKGAPSVNWLEALSLLMSSRIDSSLQVIKNQEKDTINSFLIRHMATAKPNGSDQEKLFYLKFHVKYFDTTTFKNIVHSIENDDLKAEAILSFSKKLFDHDLTDEAIDVFSLLTDLKISEKRILNEIKSFELKLFAAHGRIMGVVNYINDNKIEFPFEKFSDRVFYTGLINAASGDTIAALINFRWVAKNNPFNEMEVVLATDYIKIHSNDKFEAYELLLGALEINPNSVRLLKAYIREAYLMDLDQFAENALMDLKELLSPEHYTSFTDSIKIKDEEVF